MIKIQKEKKKNKNLYDFDYETEAEKKKKSKADKKSASKKKKNNVQPKEGQATKKYDDEIIIGVTRLPEPKKEKTNKNATKDSKTVANPKKLKSKKTKVNKQTNSTKSGLSHKQNQVYNYDEDIYNLQIKNKFKKKRIMKIVRIVVITLILIGTIVFCMVSPIFNVNTIIVTGNSQVTQEQIISLSQIQQNQNIFKYSKTKIIKNVKQNAYINNVTVKKALPNIIKIEVQERIPQYMLEFGNSYVYINNQGYILDISNNKLELPIILGTSTKEDQIVAGNRLAEEDLIKLGTIIKIMDAAQTNKIENLITTIDISDEENYTLYIEQEKKTAYLGDCSNLETRMLYLVAILNKEKNIEGEIFINMNLNMEDPFFRESI